MRLRLTEHTSEEGNIFYYTEKHHWAFGWLSIGSWSMCREEAVKRFEKIVQRESKIAKRVIREVKI